MPGVLLIGLCSLVFGEVLGALQPIASPPGPWLRHHEHLLEGIDHICPEHRSSRILVLYYDDLAAALPSFSALSRWIPVTVQNANLVPRTYHWGTSCVVGFFNDTFALEHAERHYAIFYTRILVCPESELENILKVASTINTCITYFFAYDPLTLRGVWSIYQPTNRIWTLAEFRGFEKDMRGYEIGFMNMDLLRDNTYDVAIGQTIARRHNGTFQLMMGFDPDQCIDYDHMLMYMGPGYYIPLPAMSAMCFIVPKSGPKSVFLVLLDPYDRYSWAAFGVTIGVVALALTLFGESSRTSNFVLVLLELLMIVLNGPTHQLAGRFERYVVGLFMLLGIVLISGYQSLVISFMASARYEPQLDTIERINDTCLFVHSSDMVRAGYRFKNIIHSLDIFASSQLMWELKWCSVAACTEAQYVMEHVGNADKPREPEPGELMLYDQEQWGMMKRQLQLFRYSKAHMQTSTSLYRAGFNSPVRHLVHWYTQAFIEGCLHHYPVLRKTPPKAEVILQDTLEAPGVKRMGLTDLVIGWALFCLGIGLSAMSFTIELGIVGARKLKHIIRVRLGRKKRAFIRL